MGIMFRGQGFGIRLTCVVLGCAAVVGAAAGRSEGGFLHLEDTREATKSVSGWTARWGSEPISSAKFVGPKKGNNFGTFSLRKTLMNANPVSIDFTEDNLARENRFGLRITLNEEVINATNKDLVGFVFQVSPLRPIQVPDGANRNTDAVSPQASAMHPSAPHFHDDELKDLTNTMKVLSTDNDPTFSIVFGGGTVGPLGTWKPNGIGIHDFEVNEFQRAFRVTEVPIFAAAVPEAGSFALLATGLLVALTFRRRLRRRAAT